MHLGKDMNRTNNIKQETSLPLASKCHTSTHPTVWTAMHSEFMTKLMHSLKILIIKVVINKYVSHQNNTCTKLIDHHMESRLMDVIFILYF